MTKPMVGDSVLVSGTALKVIDGVGTLVEFFSKTDQYQGWIREEDVMAAPPTGMPDEPADGVMLHSTYGEDGNASIFRRDDAEGHNDPDRRYDRHWWDYAAREWIDWPTAVERGANIHKRLVEA